MALITDPDLLSQGTSTTVADLAFTATAGAVTTITGATTLPVITAGAYFEIRGATDPNNNGLYTETGGAPSTSSITATKLDGDGGAVPADDTAASTFMLHTESALSDEKSVYIDIYNRKIWLIKQGNLSVDGATLQAAYSFVKEEWKNDNDLIPHPFPFTAITPEQFEMTDGWVFHTGSIGPGTTTETRKLVRTGGWREITSASVLTQEYVGVISLGSFEDSAADIAYYQQGADPTDTSASTDFTFAGAVNEAVLSYDYVTTDPSDTFTITSTNVITRTTGDWVTEGYRIGGSITIVTSDNIGDLDTYVITALSTTVLTLTGTLTNGIDATFTAAVNNRNVLNVYLRIRDGDTNGKTFGLSTLPDIGVAEVDNKVFRFPLTNATDLKIASTDATITGGSPWTEINVRYFDQAYSKDIDTVASPRNFGIVVDVGTHSGVDGSMTSAGSVLTTAEGGVSLTNYDGGVLTVHEGTNAGQYRLEADITSATALGIVVDGSLTPGTATFSTTESNSSFTLQRVTPVVATAEQIYEKVQYLLRQAADIDATDQAVNGKTADALLRFVGDTLESGQAAPSNPNAGGSGVLIEGFAANDTNRLTFFDNAATSRTFPFVAAGSVNFNNNLQNDTDAKFWMFYQYTVRTTTTNAVTLTASGSVGTFTSTAGAVALPVLVAGDFINITRFPANSVNNGIYRVTAFTDTTTGGFVARKVNGDTLVTETSAGADVKFDENPIDSPSALIVNSNGGVPISGLISGASSFSFDYDYDNNEQGERVSGQGDAAVIVRAIGFNTAQFVETNGTITRATGIVIALVSSLERNYANAA
jgi:hypothetical protein